MNLTSMLALSLVGCSGSAPLLGGTPIWELFPFDGERTWEYTSTDTSLPYLIVAQSNLEPERKGDVNIYTVNYSTDCFGNSDTCVDGEIVRSIKWSSSVLDGVFFHAYDVGNGFVDLSPPVQLGAKEMLKDESVETTSDNTVWTSTFLGIEACPEALTADWPECGSLEIVAEGNSDGSPLAGQYWATKGNGVAGFHLADEGGTWQLSSIDCTGTCDGEW